ncbi:MAG: rod shape-determining protein RodA [Candidatus Berkelbacteria bacterium]|nr:rod shape-determining protein RodA [Candidatus Berkelbacteria bacterium]
MKIPKIRVDLDWSLVVIPVLLIVGSIATLYSIASFSGKGHLALNQIIFFGIGIAVYLFFTFFDYRELKKYSWYLYVMAIFLLLIVGVWGETIFGSKRWIDLGFFQFQPSELSKLIILIFGGYFFSSLQEFSYRKLIFFILLCALPITLILLEPDLGTALSICVLIIAVLIGARVPRLVFIVAAAIALISLPVAWSSLKDYQRARVYSFISPASDPLKSGYNVNQSKIAVGSGGLWGKGFGGATQSQLQFLPISHIDFIFASWGEATGFAGSVALIAVYAILIWRVFYIASLSRDEIGSLFCTGIGAVFLFQSFVNIGMNIGLAPVTGIPLPYFSYGGTSIIISSALLGIVQSVYLRRKSLKFD